MTENALKCKWNGGGWPVGYYIDVERHLQIDPATSPFVIEAFKRYADGATILNLVQWLNNNGVQTYRKLPFRIDAVNRLLKNRAYIGEYKCGEIITPGGVPAIVPLDLFEQVQECLAKNKKATARHKAEDDYLLTTKLFCGKCGAYMVGESGTSHTTKVHHYYKCVTAKKRQGCDKKSTKKDWIENIVVNEAVELVSKDSILEKLAAMVMDLQKRENTTLPLLRKQLTETERGIENMLNAIQHGILTPSTRKRLDDLEAVKGDLEVRILQEEMQKPLLTREQIMFWLHRFRGIDTTQRDQRQRLIDTFVNAVYLYDDKLLLTFNWQDDSKTITVAEIQDSYGSDLTASSAGKHCYSNTNSGTILFRAFVGKEVFGITIKF